MFPEIAKEWHPSKNKKTPDQVNSQSNKKYWWKCPEGPDHEWQAPPYAILDDNGQVLEFVSPAPGLNLHRYLKKRVGVFGYQSYLPSLKTPHITVYRIVDLAAVTGGQFLLPAFGATGTDILVIIALLFCGALICIGLVLFAERGKLFGPPVVED